MKPSTTNISKGTLPTQQVLDERHIQALCRIVGRQFVLEQPEERLVYESDACLLMRALPDLIVLPNSTQEVAQIVSYCKVNNIAYIARGAGTGLSGGALTIEGGIIIGLNRMNRIREIDPQNRTATVEVGVVNAWLNEATAEHGLFYAPDPSSQSACTIGGNLAENAGGIHCIKYGVTTNHVLALEMVLPDGTVTWLGSKNRRQAGLNLTGLMVGSEGTLGIITQAVLQLTPKPTHIRAYLASFATVAQATDAVKAIIASGMVPAALEYMDAFTVRAVNEAFNIGFPEDSEAVLLIEIDGDTEGVEADHARLEALVNQYTPGLFRWADTDEERKAIWAARKGAVAAYGRLYPAFYLHDCVIPRSQLTHVLTEIERLSQEYDMVVGNVFHAGDGNLHPNILFDPDDSVMVERILKGGEAVLEVCLKAGGTLSGEHGIGMEKSQYMDRLFSPEDLAKMTGIKKALDPTGLANPAKIFPQPRGCGETTHAMNLDAARNPGQPDGVWI